MVFTSSSFSKLVAVVVFPFVVIGSLMAPSQIGLGFFSLAAEA